MKSRTEGLRATAPVKWLGLDGAVGCFWQMESRAGANCHFVSPDPRILVYFNDVSTRIRMSNRGKGQMSDRRAMARAVYVPPGTPMWTETSSQHRFTHLDLHVHRDRMLRLLSASIGTSAAMATMRRPAEIEDIGAIEPLANLLAEEIANPAKPSLYAESLINGIVGGLLDVSGRPCEEIGGRLSEMQLKMLIAAVDAREDGRLSVTEMADMVGLSESWFTNVFKQTTGSTPLQWQLARRIETAKVMLSAGDMSVADIAARLGFSDQAHLTRVFRQAVGGTPAAWRRLQNA